MEINQINEIVNDLAVLRLEKNAVEEELNALLATPQIVELQKKLEFAKAEVSRKQYELLSVMKDNELKSWKTETGTFSRISKFTVKIDPNYEKRILEDLKKGDKVENFELKQSEYISIRALKK